MKRRRWGREAAALGRSAVVGKVKEEALGGRLVGSSIDWVGGRCAEILGAGFGGIDGSGKA